MSIIAIDFEASCLPRHGRSFPIEVGIACRSTVRSWIIRPHDDWQGWDWTNEAQGLHGLTRAQVERDGQDVRQVLAELIMAVDGRRVVADSVIDQYWLDTLATAAGGRSPFAIDHISLILDEYRAGERAITQAIGHADARYPGRHRAADDALWLSAVLGHLAGDAPADPRHAHAGMMLPMC